MADRRFSEFPSPTRKGRAAARAEREAQAEVQLHLELRVQELIQSGHSRDQAEALAREQFGDPRAVCRDVGRIAALDARRTQREELMLNLVSDLRVTLRKFARRPGFVAATVLTLALGIGANSAIFSVVHGILLQPLPYPEADRLVRLFEESPRVSMFPVAPGNYLEYRRENGVFDNIAIFTRDDLQLSDGDPAVRLTALRVSAGYFETLGYQPALGRTFTTQDELAGNSRRIVISDRVWRERFDADPGVVGRDVSISGEAYEVLGVMPPSVQHVGGSYRSTPHGETVDAWWPLTLEEGRAPRNAHYTNGIGRLRSGVEVGIAQQSMAALSQRLSDDYPETNTDWTVTLVPLRDEILGTTAPLLWTLLGAAGFVLLIACANVANLMLAGATGQRREVAIRGSLGASRGRIGRLLLTEALVLASAGGAAGLFLGWAGTRALLTAAPEGLPRLHEIGLHPPVLFFTLVVTLATGLVFGIAPALRAVQTDIMDTLRNEGTAATSSRQAGGVRKFLVVLETALAFALMVGAGLFLRSFLTIVAIEPGFAEHGTLTASFALPSTRYGELAQQDAFYRDLDTRLRGMPGVLDVGIGSDLPWTGYDENSNFGIVGFEQPEDMRLLARYHFRGPGTFAATGVPVIAGREFDASDGPQTEPVILINEAAAERYWNAPEGAGPPLGSQMQVWGDTRTVVGVVGTVTDSPTDTEARPAFYFPIMQRTMPGGGAVFVAVRAEGDPAALVPAFRRVLNEIDPALALADVRTLTDIAGSARATERFTSQLVGLFAMLALVLAIAGIYGVLAYLVGERSREIGIRMALGADRPRMLRMVAAQGLRLVAAGLLLGWIAAFTLVQGLQSLLFGISARDPWTFAGVTAILLVVAAAASYLPARRASRVPPLEVLR
ncbi:MAG: FtsX-like permease family protein [Acidobacteria bacterium]|nr:FtsX-like permease family protein [Acidobacteriota bacterium]